MEENNEILNTLANFCGKEIKNNKLIDSKLTKSSEVTKTIVKAPNTDFYCIGVPGKSFYIKSDDKISVTGNTEHCEGLIQLFKEFCSEHPRVVNDEFKKKIYEMARKTYNLESRFIDLAYKMGDIKGLDKADVKLYMKYLIDRRLISMGLRGNYKVKVNPIPWLDEIIGSPIHENFFETQVTDYQKGGMEGSWADAW